MKSSTWTILILLQIPYFAYNQTIDELKKEYIYEALKVYIEKPQLLDTSSNRYTYDNRVYKLNRKFIYDYFIIKGPDTLKFVTPKISSQDIEPQRDWGFISINEENRDKIESFSITVLPGLANVNQTKLKYEYQYLNDLENEYFGSTSGVIENKINTWMHPPRDRYFMILELNPFPYIQQPFKVGNKWDWTLGIGDHWMDDRWKTWSGSINNNYEYEIIREEKLKTKIGEMDCWVIQSKGSSSIGTTELTNYYNVENGFVKLDYVNIDRSKVIIEIKEIR